MKQFLVILVLVAFISCIQPQRKKENTKYEKEIIQLKNNSKPKVLFALDIECPLCKSYSKKINEIQIRFQKYFDFYAFLPSRVYSKEKTNDFIRNNKLSMNIIVDTNQVITHYLNAKITPECFLVDSNLNTIYTGLIDDRIKELGCKSQFIENDYLINSLNLYLNNESIQIKETQAIGCIIQK